MELIKLLPDYYDKNVTMQTLQTLLSEVTDDLENGLSSTISECFASTASGLLSRYEQLLGWRWTYQSLMTFGGNESGRRYQGWVLLPRKW